MNEWIFAEPLIRLGAFASVFALMTLWELAAPRRRMQLSRAWRWSNNLGIVLVDTVLLRLLFPIAAVGTALYAESAGWGLLQHLPLPYWATVLLAVLLLDLAIWAQHLLFHYVPPLWRLHRMHHSDTDFDVTTGLRFHPVEIVLSMLIKMGIVLALGASALAVLLFEVLLNATSLFNHGNVRLPAAMERALRWVVVTPDMHRVHHSWHREETNSNFGFNLPWWDRLFGTYRAQPRDGHDSMTLGLHAFRALRDARLDRLLIQPLLPVPSPPAQQPGDARYRARAR